MTRALAALWLSMASMAHAESAQSPPDSAATFPRETSPAQTGNANWTPRHDHMDHAVYSAAVVLGTNALLTGWAVLDMREKRPSFLGPFWVRWLLSVGAGVVVGLVKEGFDALGGGSAEGSDLLADGVGVLGGAGVLLVGRF